MEHLKPYIMFVLNPKFKDEIRDIRNDFDIDSDEFDNWNEETIKKFELLQENNSLDIRVEKFRKKAKLSKRWQDFLIHYVITGDVLPSYDIYGLRLEIQETDEEEKEYLLHLTEETTLKDIIMAWPLIQKNLKKNNKRKKPWKNFWRDYDIYKWADEGKTVNEIDGLVIKKYGKSLDYGNIVKIESSFRKKVGISKLPKKHKLKMIS